jgi:hypothetical protein
VEGIPRGHVLCGFLGGVARYSGRPVDRNSLLLLVGGGSSCMVSQGRVRGGLFVCGCCVCSRSGRMS